MLCAVFEVLDVFAQIDADVYTVDEKVYAYLLEHY